jgi:signal transduction histidine kinase
MPSTILRALLLCAAISFSAASTAQTAAIEKLQRSLPQIKDSTTYVDKLNRIAILMHMKDPDSCFLYAAKAKSIATRRRYAKGVADANATLGVALSQKGLNHDALKMLSKALDGYQELGDVSNAAMVYMNLASTHRYLSDSISCVRALRKGIALSRRRPNDSIMAVVYSAYCNLAPGLSQDSSRYYLDKMHRIAVRYNDKKILVMEKLLEASYLLGTPQQAKALPLVEAAIAESDAAGLEYPLISAYDLLAKYYGKDPDKALDYYDKVLEILDKNGYVTLKSLVLQRMMPYAERSADKKREVALARQLAHEVSEKQYRLSQFFSDYVRFTDLEDANRLLEAESGAKRKRLLILASFSAGCALLLMIIFLLYRRSRKASRLKSELNMLLEQKNGELEAADAFKNKLLSILAHDFRAPLVSTVSVLEMLKSDMLEPEEVKPLYRQVQDDTNAMLALFDNTLQWIRRQLKGYDTATGNHLLRPLMDEAVNVFAHELIKKNISVRNEVPEGLEITTDREMLQFINRNLVSNAIKFSPQGGAITIKASLSGGKVAVSVSDQGEGLDQKTIAGLFAISSTGSTKHGAGIALAMCKDFIEKLGGSIEARNGREGAVFNYCLPVGG